MMDKISIDSIGKFIAYAWPKRKTKVGLFFSYLVLIFCFVIIPLNFLDTLNRVAIYISFFPIVYITWLFESGRLILPSKKIRIAFALKANDPSTQKVIDVTISRVKEYLKMLKILGQFKFYEIGTDIFETNEQAEKFLKKKNLDLIIHGTVYKGKEESNFRYDFKNSFFTIHFKKPKAGEYFRQLFVEDIDAMVKHRTWIIDDNNDLNDTIKVSKNFLEIILSLIAIILSTTSKTLSLSITLSETLLPILDQKIDPKIEIVRSKEQNTVKIPIELFRSGRLRNILANSYNHISRMYIDEKKYPDAISSSLKGLQLGANKIDCFASLALAHYYLGELDKAEEYTNSINKHSENSPVYFVNKAFFSIKRKEYKEAQNYYSNLRKHFKERHIEPIIKPVIKFLNERAQEDCDEIAYLYAIGILTYNFIEKETGLKILDKFLQKTKNMQNYEPLIIEAKKIQQRNK